MALSGTRIIQQSLCVIVRTRVGIYKDILYNMVMRHWRNITSQLSKCIYLNCEDLFYVLAFRIRYMMNEWNYKKRIVSNAYVSDLNVIS